MNVSDRVEAFFKQRGADIFHEVSPLADPTTFALLNERGYQPIEFTSVLFRPISPDVVLSASPNGNVKVRVTGENDKALWSDIAFEGWSEFTELSDFLRDMGKVHACSKSPSFLAELDDQPIATGMLTIHEGVALLAGASTIPTARRQGAQLALLEARLRYGAQQGCDIAMMAALPGSASQRNAERHGFLDCVYENQVAPRKSVSFVLGMVPLVTLWFEQGALFWDRRRPRLPTLQCRVSKWRGVQARVTPAVPERARPFKPTRQRESIRQQTALQ